MERSKFAGRFREIVEGEGTWSDKFDKIMKIKREEEGLKGFHFSVFPKEGQVISKEAVAKDLCLMILEDAEGRCKEITGEEL